MTDPAPPVSQEVGSAPRGDRPAGQSIDAGKGRIFPCEGCGADLVFHIGVQSLKCPYCGFEKAIALCEDRPVAEQDFHTMLVRLKELRDQGAPRQEVGQSEVRCEACGATVVFVGPLTSSECPYCGSPIQRNRVHDSPHRIPVDGVLPFQVPKQNAQANLSRWVKSRWFAPNDFLQRGVEGKFNGVYLPFWTFDTLTLTRYTGQRGEYYYVSVGTGNNRRQERRTRWYPASGQFQRFFDDVLVPAARNLNDGLMRALEPWPLGKCVHFNQEMLAGYLARTYEVELEEGFRQGRQHIDAELAADVRRRIGGDTQRVHSINTRYDAVTYKHLLLPVWLLAYRYHEKTYQVMVNAATGEVQGERPYSWVKITLAVLAVLAIAGSIALLR